MRIRRAVLAPRMLVLTVYEIYMESGHQETQIEGESGSHSSRGDLRDQNQRYLHLVRLERNLMQQYESDDMCSRRLLLLKIFKYQGCGTMRCGKHARCGVGSPTDARRAWCGTYHSMKTDQVECVRGRRRHGG
jgi:hypothetical protein